MHPYDLAKLLERGREVHDTVGDRAFAPTGDAYVTLQGFGGAEGARLAFMAYAAGRNGKLYWRTPPELRGRAYGDGEEFFMRLFIAGA